MPPRARARRNGAADDDSEQLCCNWYMRGFSLFLLIAGSVAGTYFGADLAATPLPTDGWSMTPARCLVTGYTYERYCRGHQHGSVGPCRGYSTRISGLVVSTTPGSGTPRSASICATGAPTSSTRSELLATNRNTILPCWCEDTGCGSGGVALSKQCTDYDGGLVVAYCFMPPCFLVAFLCTMFFCWSDLWKAAYAPCPSRRQPKIR